MDRDGICACKSKNVWDAYGCTSSKECNDLCKNKQMEWERDLKSCKQLEIGYNSDLTSASSVTSSLELSKGVTTLTSNGTNTTTLANGSNNYVMIEAPDTTDYNSIQWDHSNSLTADATIAYSDGSITTKSFKTEALHVDGPSELKFDNPGKIKNVDKIEFSNGAKLTFPKTSTKENQVLVYNGKGQLEWKSEPSFVNLEERMTRGNIFLSREIAKTQNEIQQLKKEMEMINVHAVWGFTDYLSVFLIALLAIWFVKHISWKVVLTPIKKLFKFGEKKVKEAEEELKKAEQTWKEID